MTHYLSEVIQGRAAASETKALYCPQLRMAEHFCHFHKTSPELQDGGGLCTEYTRDDDEKENNLLREIESSELLSIPSVDRWEIVDQPGQGRAESRRDFSRIEGHERHITVHVKSRVTSRSPNLKFEVCRAAANAVDLKKDENNLTSMGMQRIRSGYASADSNASWNMLMKRNVRQRRREEEERLPVLEVAIDSSATRYFALPFVGVEQQQALLNVGDAELPNSVAAVQGCSIRLVDNRASCIEDRGLVTVVLAEPMQYSDCESEFTERLGFLPELRVYNGDAVEIPLMMSKFLARASCQDVESIVSDVEERADKQAQISTSPRVPPISHSPSLELCFGLINRAQRHSHNDSPAYSKAPRRQNRDRTDALETPVRNDSRMFEENATSRAGLLYLGCRKRHRHLIPTSYPSLRRVPLELKSIRSSTCTATAPAAIIHVALPLTILGAVWAVVRATVHAAARTTAYPAVVATTPSSSTVDGALSVVWISRSYASYRRALTRYLSFTLVKLSWIS
ncbi:hypothetical protein DFH09DRAFT_1073775 [Mycena vulgaris]|nr:hypothetical protein DFH09DRAFT_1073775 [Mycena vulgaris]